MGNGDWGGAKVRSQASPGRQLFSSDFIGALLGVCVGGDGGGCCLSTIHSYYRHVPLS